VRILRAWANHEAARDGYEILEVVSDPGQSGASLERPGMDQVRDLVAAGGVSVVPAQGRDRFSREPAYTYLLRREFEEHGTRMRALKDRGDESPEGNSHMASSISSPSSSVPRQLREPAGVGSERLARER
jgi:site-specific DNA recombinase